MLVTGRETARARAERLRALPEVASVRWLASFVPDAQAEKLAQIEELGFIMGPGLGGMELAAVDVARDGAALRALRATLAASADPSPGAERLEAALADWLAGPVSAERLRTLTATLLGTLPGELERLATALGVQPVAFEDLPAELAGLWHTGERTYRLEVVPAANIGDNDAARAFVRAVEGVAENATGLPATQIHAGRTVVTAFVEALVLAVALIAAFLFGLTRSVLRTVEILAPLVLAGLATTGTAALAGVPFNFANVITLPLLLGVGVDNGIHMAHRMEVAPPVDGNLLATGTARAIVFSALTTVASFGSLMLSDHPGTASMGTLLTIGMVFAVAATLIVLPALLMWRRRP